MSGTNHEKCRCKLVYFNCGENRDNLVVKVENWDILVFYR